MTPPPAFLCCNTISANALLFPHFVHTAAWRTTRAHVRLSSHKWWLISALWYGTEANAAHTSTDVHHGYTTHCRNTHAISMSAFQLEGPDALQPLSVATLKLFFSGAEPRDRSGRAAQYALRALNGYVV